MPAPLAGGVTQVPQMMAQLEAGQPLEVDRPVEVSDPCGGGEPNAEVLVGDAGKTALVGVVARHHVEAVAVVFDRVLHAKSQEYGADAELVPALVLIK